MKKEHVNRSDMVEVFMDTKFHYENDEILIEAIKHTKKNSKVYDENELAAYKERNNKLGVIKITKSKSFEAAGKLHKQYPNKRIGVLNFANAFHPGGGVESGSRAQEEALCRCSTLYPCLQDSYIWNNYYSKNRARYTPLANDRVVVTPDIVVFKSDDDYPTIVEEKDFFKVDVLTCAAPNLRNRDSSVLSIAVKGEQIGDEELYKIHYSRAEHILCAALANDIDILVLGAFGCGAFQNNPRVVAKAYNDIIKKYRDQFDVIEFAIYCRDFETENYDSFVELIEK